MFLYISVIIGFGKRPRSFENGLHRKDARALFRYTTLDLANKVDAEMQRFRRKSIRVGNESPPGRWCFLLAHRCPGSVFSSHHRRC